MNIKRCNNCQELGHFYKECPTPTVPCCAKCGLDHRTNNCNATAWKCINCVKSKEENPNHATFDHKCPTMLKLLKKRMKSQEPHLNLR